MPNEDINALRLIAQSLVLPGEDLVVTSEECDAVDGYVTESDDGVRHFRIVRGLFDGYVVKFDGDVPNRTFHVRAGKVEAEPL